MYWPPQTALLSPGRQRDLRQAGETLVLAGSWVGRQTCGLGSIEPQTS